MHRLDHPPLEPLRPAGRRLDQPPCVGQRLRVRPEHLVGHRHLCGMDQRLAVKAQMVTGHAFRRQPVQIVQPVIDPVEHRDARRPRRQHHRLHRQGQPFAPRTGGYAKVAAQVINADEQRRAPFARRDGRRGQHALCAFDHRDHRLLRHAEHVAHLLGILDLGQHHIIGARSLHRDHLHAVPGRPFHIDPHAGDAPAKAFGQRRHRPGARIRLRLVRHGILQVQYHHVARQAARLGDGARIGCGQEQQRTGMTQQHRNSPWFDFPR